MSEGRSPRSWSRPPRARLGVEVAPLRRRRRPAAERWRCAFSASRARRRPRRQHLQPHAVAWEFRPRGAGRVARRPGVAAGLRSGGRFLGVGVRIHRRRVAGARSGRLQVLRCGVCGATRRRRGSGASVAQPPSDAHVGGQRAHSHAATHVQRERPRLHAVKGRPVCAHTRACANGCAGAKLFACSGDLERARSCPHPWEWPEREVALCGAGRREVFCTVRFGDGVCRSVARASRIPHPGLQRRATHADAT